MPRDEAVDGEIGDDIAIINKDRFAIDPVSDVFNAATCFEKDGFVEEGELGSAIGSVRKCLSPRFMKVMSVDCKVVQASGDAVIHDMSDEGAIFKWDQGFGQGVGEWLEAGSEACS